MEERRGEKASEKRAAIKKATRDLILKFGIRGATMKDVAFQSGIPRRTLYRYYTGIEEIAKEIYQDYFKSDNADPLQLDASGANGYERLRSRCYSVFDYCVKNDKIIKYFLEYDYYFRKPDQADIHAYFQKRPRLFADILEQGLEDGTIDVNKAHIDKISRTISNSIMAMAQRIIIREDVYRLEQGFTREDIRFMVDLFLKALKKGK